MTAREVRLKALGLCVECGHAAVTRNHCHVHAKVASARANAYYHRTKVVRQIQTRARRKVASAIRSGLLVRPSVCSRCGISETKINGHHHDYSKPLEVEWLCYRCHAAVEGRGQ